MLSKPRNVALVLVAVLTLAAMGCNSNAKKIVGKWKVTSVGDETAQKAEGIDFVLEFKSDGSLAANIVATDPKVQEVVKKLNENPPSFKWSVNGDKIELTTSSKDKTDGFFGKKEKATGTIKFEGDTLTITPDDPAEKVVKLTKVK